MIRPAVLLAFLGSLIFLWHECGQDLAVFCYRIGLGAVTGLRSRALVALRSTNLSASGTSSECLTPSFASSTRFSILTD